MIFLIVLSIFALIATAMLVFGGLLLFKKSKYDVATTATVTAVMCQQDTNKCNITLKYKDQSNKEVTRTAIVKGPITVGSTRGILYDSGNPNNFYPSQPPVKAVGGGIFVGGLVIATACVISAYFRYRPTPVPEAKSPSDIQPEYNTVSSPKSPSAVQPEPNAVTSPPINETPTFKYEYSAFPEKQQSVPTELIYEPGTVRAKQYADYMVDKVTEPARTPKN